jgi:hypothetical protein
MGGGVAVQEFPGGPVDVVDAASDQDGLHPPAWRTGGSGAGVSGKGGAPLVVPLRASGGRAEAGQARWGVGCGGRRCFAAWPGCLSLRRAVVWGCGTMTGRPGDSPALAGQQRGQARGMPGRRATHDAWVPDRAWVQHQSAAAGVR